MPDGNVSCCRHSRPRGLECVDTARGQTVGLGAKRERRLPQPLSGRLCHMVPHQQDRLNPQAPLRFGGGDRPTQQLNPGPRLLLGPSQQRGLQLGQQRPRLRLKPGLQRLQPHFWYWPN